MLDSLSCLGFAGPHLVADRLADLGRRIVLAAGGHAHELVSRLTWKHLERNVLVLAPFSRYSPSTTALPVASTRYTYTRSVAVSFSGGPGVGAAFFFFFLSSRSPWRSSRRGRGGGSASACSSRLDSGSSPPSAPSRYSAPQTIRIPSADDDERPDRPPCALALTPAAPVGLNGVRSCVVGRSKRCRYSPRARAGHVPGTPRTCAGTS